MRFVIFALMLFVFETSMAQPFGNEWIDYSAKHYKIQVVETGFYRITHSNISGFSDIIATPLSSLKLFYKGEEQPIMVYDANGNNFFDVADFFEFYGEKNNGKVDTIMYIEPSFQTNPYYSLINDTSSYFLTFNISTPGLRFAPETDVAFAGYSPTTYCLKEVFQEFTSNQFIELSGPLLDVHEGYFDSYIDINGYYPLSKTKTFSTPNVVGGQTAIFDFAFISASNESTITGYNHHVQMSLAGTTLLDTTFLGKKSIYRKFSVSSSSLSSSTSAVFSVVNDIGQSTDKNALSWIRLKYPHSFDFEGAGSFEFLLPNSSSGKTYLEITNFNFGSSTPRLYDITNKKIISLVNDAGVLKALVPNSAHDYRKCILVAQNGVLSIPQPISFVALTDYTSYGKNSDYIIITNKKLITGANLYKAYRQSSGYNPAVFDVDQIYLQFGYGIDKHPMGIRNFLNYIINNYTEVPKHLFFMGKSVKFNSFRNNTYAWEQCLVPSFGSPASDILFSAGLNGTHFQPAIPTGRISVRSNDEISLYLNKVEEYESNIPALWMKNIIHFGGGGHTAEQVAIDNYLNIYKQQIEDIHFGGKVSDFRKTSSDPIQISMSDSIINLINNGVSIVTFFGHGSTNGWDISIDEPESYDNYKKYPLLIANSCLSGDIHILNDNISESWVVNQKGAIGFIASTGEALRQYLHGFSTELYKQIGFSNYNQAIGVQLQKTIETWQTGYWTNPYVRNTCYEFSLHGDPAVVINSHEKPDLEITNSDLYFNPAIISNEVDSFTLNLGISNIGKASRDTFMVRVRRTMPNDNDTVVLFPAPGVLYRDTVSIKMPVDFINGPGLNSFDLYVDASFLVDELREDNNQISQEVIVISNDVIPIWPYEYAIYPENTVSLKASVNDLFLGSSGFAFQMDTSDMFNSPSLLSTTLTASGGVIEWTPPITLQDSMVYYWRVSKIPTGDEEQNWKESSFIYIPGKQGWSQAHFFQFKKDKFQFINYERDPRLFSYVNSPRALHCHNIGSPSTAQYILEKIAFFIDNVVVDYTSCGTGSKMHVAVIDSFTLATIPTSDTCPGRLRPDYYKKFYTGDIATVAANTQAMVDYINNVEDGHYVLMYSFFSGNFQEWEEPVYVAMEGYGSDDIRTIPNNYPYILFFKKGDPTTAVEVIGESANDEIDLYVNLDADYTTGNITSVLIGPAYDWKTLHWKKSPLDFPDYDMAEISISGIRLDGTSETVLSNIVPPEYDILDLSPIIDAGEFPYLKMQLETEDDSLKTPPQLNKWQLTYDAVPETALDPASGFYFYADTVYEGETVEFCLSTKNVSDYDMDSLLILYIMQDRNNRLDTIALKRCRPHPSGDVLLDTIRINTINKQGLNSIWMEVNPFNPSVGGYDQLEQFHFNNIAQKFFYVRSDNINPLLDVTFDGMHILNGDIVSANPEILVKLKDENKYLELNDTSLFALFIKFPGETDSKRVYFTNIEGEEQLIFTPANLPNNSCEILYQPTFESDGVYELIVQARDKSNNESGDFDYRLTFEVINKSTITDVFNYPNPFSTSTRFVFTLTGSEIPDDFRIQILTVTGKLVREIGLDELGPIRIGRNITEYAWDGKDMFGDQLANGVYFYRVFTKINGESVEKRETGAEKYFKKGFGKMYLMR
ncbi:MAG: hypothetical protein JXR58_00325 [Bacteroidales bacterium]|nr:hypothetical protein [Bacteroidales bacterium]